MLDLSLRQAHIHESSETSFEEFKSTLADYLNQNPSDRHAQERWSISKISEGEVALLVYDERPIVDIKIETNTLRISSDLDPLVRYDDIMFAIRTVAQRLGMSILSHLHGKAHLPKDPSLVFDHTFFRRDKNFLKFFEHSGFIPRFCSQRYEAIGDDYNVTINPPIYAEDKKTGAIHLINFAMLDFLTRKDNQDISSEFSYQVAGSLDDFSSKFDTGLIPISFYKYYERSSKIINNTDFNIDVIDRKVFIDPYVWNFDTKAEPQYLGNTKNGLHLMDKIRRGENLDSALKRVLRDELKIADDYVGVRIWGIEFDRDKDGLLTPRLKMDVFIHDLDNKRKRSDHDWVSLS